MLGILQHSYCLEAFDYYGTGARDQRQRPTVVWALLGGSGVTQMPTVQPGAARNSDGTSIANFSAVTPTTVDWSQTDLFLGAFDNGHLIGSALGGSRASYNLVPMTRRGNRGGDWAAFESTVRNSSGHGLYIVKCTYTPGRDPRIPSAVEAAFLPLSSGFAGTLNSNWGSWHNRIETAAATAGAGALGTQVAAAFAPTEVVSALAIRSCRFQQEEFRADTLPLFSTELFIPRYRAALTYVATNNWRIENDGRSRYQVDNHAPDTDFAPTYRLAAPADRLYAALDYMALNGELHDCLVGATANNVSPNERHDDVTFNPQMRTLVMMANMLHNWERISGQRVFLSDARARDGHADPGTLGEGMVMSPEFDHLIPVTPVDGGLRGPTIFSNVQLTSPYYNSTKGGNLWIAPAVTIGYRMPRRARRHSIRGTDVAPMDTGTSA